MSASRAISGQLGKILKDFRPDVIHAHTLGFDSSIGCWLKKKLNCPLVVTTHGSDTEIPLGRGEHRWLKTMCDQADQIVAVSNRLKQRLLSCDPETPVSTVLNGFVPNIESTCGPKEPLSILQVGHLIPSKRNAVTIQALSRLREIYPQITLTVIGAGVLRQQLEELVKDLGLTDAVTFTGQVPNPKVLEAMARSSYFIMPSKPEGFGIVYLEAMSNGCITVGTEGEGISDLIQSSKNGFLVPADDPEAVAQVVCWCEQHPQEAAAIARRGCDDTRNLTWEHNAERYTQLFCRLTGRL
jgi:glycosyltransferase involved in cell wall biosynthesis